MNFSEIYNQRISPQASQLLNTRSTRSNAVSQELDIVNEKDFKAHIFGIPKSSTLTIERRENESGEFANIGQRNESVEIGTYNRWVKVLDDNPSCQSTLLLMPKEE